ncbi:MAG: AMP-binding protein, partial [Pseudolabrys sp.]
MKHNRVAVDRSVSPSQISFTPSFNLCGLFVDRHIEEGRADKILARGRAWTLTYGALQTAVCKFGNALKALGIRPGERVMLLAKDTP